MDFLLEPFQYEFMNRAFVVLVLVAVLCGIISCWIVLIGWSLMGEAVSHAVFPGVVISMLLGLPFALGAFVFGLIAVYLMGCLRNNSRIKEDGAIGVVFTTMFATGLMMVSLMPGKSRLSHIIFGSILSITPLDFYQIGALSLLGVGLLLYKRRDLTLYIFDPAHANAIGISTRVMQNFLLVILSLTIVVSIQAVGVVLVVAILIIPGVTASLLTRKISRMLVLSPVLAVITSVVGLYLSYIFDIAPGATIVVTMGSLFALIYLANLLYPIIRKRTYAA